MWVGMSTNTASYERCVKEFLADAVVMSIKWQLYYLRSAATRAVLHVHEIHL